MKRWWLALAWSLSGLVAGWAAPLERDLGEGLKFYRVRALPADLPPAPAPSGRVPPCVLDVRYAQADDAAATALEAWLRFRAKPRAPVFVLANTETAASLLSMLARRESGSGIAVIGVPGGQLRPDSAVKTTAKEERYAYEALEKGISVAALVTDHPEKVRNDEASLSRDRLADASAEATADALAAKPDTAVIDVALQRAIHLHRALAALRKL